MGNQCTNLTRRIDHVPAFNDHIILIHFVDEYQDISLRCNSTIAPGRDKAPGASPAGCIKTAQDPGRGNINRCNKA